MILDHRLSERRFLTRLSKIRSGISFRILIIWTRLRELSISGGRVKSGRLPCLSDELSYDEIQPGDVVFHFINNDRLDSFSVAVTSEQSTSINTGNQFKMIYSRL